MSERRRVRYQINMGASKRGEWLTGSPAELFSRFFDVARGFVPPLGPLNAKLASGIDTATEHGIHLKWEAFELAPEEYAHLCADLRERSTTGEGKVRFVTCPPEIASWEDWSWWVYATQIEPALPGPPPASPSLDEIALRRAYRKALAAGHSAEAAQLAERIRRDFNPGFS